MQIAILTPGELIRACNERLGEGVVVDARRHKHFERGHIPGAGWLGWEAWCESAPSHAGPTLAQEGYWGVLADASPEEYGWRLASAGLRLDQPLIIYGDGPRTRGREGRIAWMLLYLGASKVSLLDGGWSGWLGQHGEVECDPPSHTSGHCRVDLQPYRRCTLEQVRRAVTASHQCVLIDVRSQAEFDGEIQEYLPRRGRLPAATLVPFTALFGSDGRYVSREHYLERNPNEVQRAHQRIAYCEVGVRASLFALLHEAYTGTVVPVFDGSLMQWSLDPELPMI